MDFTWTHSELPNQPIVQWSGESGDFGESSDFGESGKSGERFDVTWGEDTQKCENKAGIIRDFAKRELFKTSQKDRKRKLRPKNDWVNDGRRRDLDIDAGGISKNYLMQP